MYNISCLINSIDDLGNNQMKNLALSMMAYTSASILGPLIVFGGLGYWLSKYFDGKAFLFVGAGIAFIVTSILQVFKVRALLKKMGAESGKTPHS